MGRWVARNAQRIFRNIGIIHSRVNRWVAPQNLPEGMSMIEAGAFAEARVSLSGPEDIQRRQGLVLEAIRRQILSKSGD